MPDFKLLPDAKPLHDSKYLHDFKPLFDQIYIAPESQNSAVAQRFIEYFGANRITLGIPEEKKGVMSGDSFTKSKRNLFLTEFKGQFFKRCPGARPGLTCCNYFVLNLGQQCHMDCSYCYLQSFLNSSFSHVYTNIEQALKELANLQELKDHKVRIGTGEVIDSLGLDPITLYSHRLIDFMKDYPKWVMEFKTKTDHIDQFIDREHAGNVWISWSINPDKIVALEEHGTASTQRRLEAARKCADKNFPISFHIDPMIWHPQWQDSYGQLVDQITARFSPEEIPVMSVGALRYQPEQRHTMRERFGMKTLSLSGEMFPSGDGKLRYDRRIRTDMFQFVMNRFKRHSKEWNIFMCMETPETWLGAFNQYPNRDQGLKEMFDHRSLRALERIQADKPPS